MEIARLILEYIKTVLTWPLLSFSGFIIFIKIFKNPLTLFITEMKIFRANREGVVLERLQQSAVENPMPNNESNKAEVQKFETAINQLSLEKAEKDKIIKDKNELVDYAIERALYFEFLYLDKVLVFNTKLALSWFYFQQKRSSTKENFLQAFKLSQSILNPETEKEAIFNALLVHGLLEESPGQRSLFIISGKGIKFLKTIHVI